MSREIKFRAWDTETKEMSYDFLSKNWLKVCIESPYVELMQYTGLKDSNGKEVYEGDICQDSLGWVFVVEWDNDCSRFIGRQHKPRGDTYICYINREPKVTIIGNIYENPSLLGDTGGDGG